MRRTVNQPLIALLLIATGAAQACELVVIDAWIRPAPPTTQTRAAYLSLENNGTSVCRITAATSASFRSVSLHRTTIVDGIARMRPLNNTEIEPGEVLAMEPGGIHLMLTGMPSDALAPIRVALQLEDGASIETELRLEVRP
jgi:periplasmic copper chaperone A